MRIILLSGAGAVGKTTQVKEIVKIAEDKGFKVATHFSSTRKTYTRFNLTNEADALKNEVFNKTFQYEVFLDNATDLLLALRKAKEEHVQFFFADRSPIDYIAYYFSVFQSSLTVDIINQKRKEAYKVMKQIEEIDTNFIISILKFPQPWSKDTESSDGWRADKTGKNFVWSSVLVSETKIAVDCKFELSNNKNLSALEEASINFDFYLDN